MSLLAWRVEKGRALCYHWIIIIIIIIIIIAQAVTYRTPRLTLAHVNVTGFKQFVTRQINPRLFMYCR